MGERGVTEWDGVLEPVRLEVPLPARTVALEVVSEGRLELDEVMVLPAVTSAVFRVHSGGHVALHVASAVAEVRRLKRGESGTVYRADGSTAGPLSRGRRTLKPGRFAVTRMVGASLKPPRTSIRAVTRRAS